MLKYPMMNSPLELLLQPSRKARAQSEAQDFQNRLALLLLLGFLMLLLLAASSWPLVATVLWIATFVCCLYALLIRPLYTCWKFGSVYERLMSKGCLEDLLASQMRASDIVDEVAKLILRQAGGDLLRHSLYCGLVVLVTLGVSHHHRAMSHSNIWAGLTGVAVPTLLCPILFFPLVFACQQWSILVHLNKNFASLIQLLQVAAGAALVWLAFYSVPLAIWGWGAFIYCLRLLAIRAVRRAPELLEKRNKVQRVFRFRPNPWIWCWSENPIIFRERAKLARKVPFGLLGATVAQFPLLCLGLALLSLGSLWRETELIVSCLVISVLIQFVRAFRYSSFAAVTEIEHKTLESTSLTALSAAHFRAGWFELVTRPLWLESGLLLMATVMVTLKFGPSPSGGDAFEDVLGFAMLGFALWLAPLLGTVFGFYCSCSYNLDGQVARSRQLANYTIAGAFLTMFFSILTGVSGLLIPIAGTIIGASFCYRRSLSFLQGQN